MTKSPSTEIIPPINDSNREALNAMVDSRCWIMLTKVGIFVLVIGSLIAYIYNKGEMHVDDKLTALIEQGKEQTKTNNAVLKALARLEYIERGYVDLKKKVDRMDAKLESLRISKN